MRTLLPLHGARLLLLVGEARPHVPCAMTKKEKGESNHHLYVRSKNRSYLEVQSVVSFIRSTKYFDNLVCQRGAIYIVLLTQDA